MRASLRTWSSTVAAAAAALFGLGACAGVPSDGQVQTLAAQEEAGLVDDPEIRVDFTGPGEDAEPLEVVRGFLAANATTEERLDRARSYLRPTVGDLWRPDSVVVVSSDEIRVSEQSVSPSEARLAWQAPVIATVDGAGRYQARAGLLQHEFQLQATNDGWRLANPPAELVLTEEDFARVYRDVSVYYLARGRAVLVPDRRFVAAGRDELPARVIAALFEGPATWLAPSVLHLEEATLEQVSVVDGVAEVRLGSDVALLTESRRSVLAAQIVSSLSGLNLSGVRILAGEELLQVDAPEVATRSDWRQFQAETGTAELHLLTAGGLTDSAGNVTRGTEELSLSEVALSAQSGQVAGVIRGGAGDSLVVVAGGEVSEVLRAARLSSPEWGGEGELYVIRNGTDLVRLRFSAAADSEGPAVETVTVDGVAAPLHGVAVAPDGARIALLGGPENSARLFLGRLDGLPGSTTVMDVHQPASALLAVSSVAWSGETQLMLGARTLTSPRTVPVTLGVDGSDVEIDRRIGLREAVSAVAAHPGGPSAVLSGGRAYVQRDDVWVSVNAAGEGETRPVYPG